jgi:hypothetical protein
MKRSHCVKPDDSRNTQQAKWRKFKGGHPIMLCVYDKYYRIFW